MLQISYKLVAFFFILKIIDSQQKLNICSLESINNYFQDISQQIRDDYLSNIESMLKSEKEYVLKRAAIGLINSVKELQKMENDFDYDIWLKDLIYLFNISEECNQKINNSFLNSQFISRVSSIQEKSYVINSYAVLISSYPKDGNLGNLTNLCPFFSKNVQKIYGTFFSDLIMNEFNDLMDEILIEVDKEKNVTCGQRSSLHELWFIYYRRMMLAFIKQTLIHFFSEIFYTVCNIESANYTFNHYQSNLPGIFERSVRTQRILQQRIHYMYQCDQPAISKDGTNHGYHELERMIQKSIINEKDLSIRKSCDNNCNLNITDHTVNHSECREIQDCRFMTSRLNICNEKEGNSRRYKWFETRHGYHFGIKSRSNKKKCDEEIESLKSFLSGFDMHFCDYCVCTCIAKPKKSNNVVTAVSFRDQVTNIYQNMVVVGVRFVKKDYMIHIQIKERQLRRRGFNDSGLWKELGNFDFNDQTGRFVVNNNNVTTPLHEGIDYGHPRIINFDDIIAPKGFVVTGVRLAYVENTLDYRKFKTKPIELQIRVTPFDYIQGMLINLHKTYWIAPEHQSHHLRTKVSLENPDDPTKSSENLLDSQPNQFMMFRASNLKKDAGQSTVPFFDASEAEGRPNFPLGGIGIIHRGQKGFGGFLAFKIFEFDLSESFEI